MRKDNLKSALDRPWTRTVGAAIQDAMGPPVNASLVAWVTRVADAIHARADQEATAQGLCVQRAGLTARTIHDPRIQPSKVRDHQCPATPQPAPPLPQPHNAEPAPARPSTPPRGTGATPDPTSAP